MLLALWIWDQTLLMVWLGVGVDVLPGGATCVPGVGTGCSFTIFFIRLSFLYTISLYFDIRCLIDKYLSVHLCFSFTASLFGYGCTVGFLPLQFRGISAVGGFLCLHCKQLYFYYINYIRCSILLPSIQKRPQM